MNRLRIVAVLLFVTAALAASANAQTGVGDIPDDGPDPNAVPVHIGPLLLAPRLQAPNIGIDTNVFDEPVNPKQDFTATVSPSTDLWMRIGRSWLKVNIREDLIWFQRYASERSANTVYTVDWHLPLNRLVFDLEPQYLSAKDRPGFEIDTRAQRTEYGAKVGVAVRAFSRTFLAVTASTDTISFDHGYTFDNVDLRSALNRTITTGGVALRQQLTPLTTIALTASREQDRFEFDPLRNANSTSVIGSVSFDPHALLKGNATFGYRDFEPVLAGLPPYRGAVGGGSLSYSLLGTTQFSGGYTRDVAFSYDVNEPYYLQSGVNGQVAQQIFGPFDVQVRGATYQLAYRERADVTGPLTDRVDHVRSYGGGIGYHFSTGLRIGFNVDHQHRLSELSQFAYDDLRYGTSVTYDF